MSSDNMNMGPGSGAGDEVPGPGAARLRDNAPGHSRLVSDKNEPARWTLQRGAMASRGRLYTTWLSGEWANEESIDVVAVDALHSIFAVLTDRALDNDLLARVRAGALLQDLLLPSKANARDDAKTGGEDGCPSCGLSGKRYQPAEASGLCADCSFERHQTGGEDD